ncbi:MAG TPA: winged helix-turn-helix domain-containing protein [Pyrinomonadaceae bacterium]|nr:winged helix-turn-helix domain-containing protein [Pyrinomonadaceae bacterium]
MSEQNHHIYEFGPFRLDAWKRVLLRDGEPVKLFPKEFETLLALVERSGEELDKDELMRRVWGETIVEEGNLAKNISHLRKVLGEKPSQHQYIVTVPGQGYRFVAGVQAGFDEVLVRERARVTVEQDDGSQIEVGENVALPRTTSAEYLISKLQQNRTATVIGLGLSIIASAAIVFALYKFSGKDEQDRSRRLKITRVTASANARDAAISPDGKYVIYVMNDGGQESLWVRQVATGGNVQIVAPAAVIYSGLTFSKEGNHVYYVRQENNAFGALYQIPAIGGAEKKLIQRVNGGVALSPDGRQLAFVRAHYPNLGEESLMVADTDGRQERVLASRKRPRNFPWWDGQAPAWSPDGKVIACITRGDEGSVHMNVIQVRVEDGVESRITPPRGWYEIKRVAWLSDASGLLITGADQASTYHAQQIWRISYPGGEAEGITSDVSNYTGMSLTADSNTMVAAQFNGLTNIWVAPDGDASRAVQLTSAGNHFDIPGSLWTPDGRIVYYSRAGGSEDLWIMDRDGSNKKQLTVDSGANFNPAVCGDGRHVVFVSDRRGTVNIWRMDIDGGNAKQLTSGSGEVLPFCSPDGQWVLYTSNSSGITAIWRMSIDGGQAVQLTDKASEQPVISPDGKLIACHYRDDPNSPWRMAIFSSEGGAPLKVFDLPLNSYQSYRWTSDARSLAYIDTREGVSNIWSQPIDSGAPEQLTDFKQDRMFFFDWSRDGKHLALARGNVVSDVVLITNFR